MVSPRGPRVSTLPRIPFQTRRRLDGGLKCFVTALKISFLCAITLCFSSFYGGSQLAASSALLLVQSLQPPAEGGEGGTLYRSRSENPIRQSSSFDPSIAWLLSLPDSGEDFLLSNLQKLTNASTTASYNGSQAGRLDDQLVPVRFDSPNGPFLMDPRLPLGRLVVAKTHCGGISDGTDRFEEMCRVSSLDDGSRITKRTSHMKPKKSILLLRSPFDFLFSQISSEVQNRDAAVRLDENTTELGAWCTQRENAQQSTQTEATRLERRDRVLCSTELSLWIRWHNQAFDTAKSLDTPVLVQFYEDYVSRLPETLNDLMSFLKLPVVDKEPLPIEPTPSYLHLLSEREIRSAAAYVRSEASPQSWYHVRRYFKGRFSPNEKDALAEQYGGTLDNPGVALLISFPNSGTSYTLINVQNVTRYSVATNTGRETRDRTPVRTDINNGPFLFEPQEGKHYRFVLTKTHCNGYCDNCNQRASSPSLIAFEKGCRTSTHIVGGTAVASTYNSSVIHRVVHLFRNPYDNLVARMHLGVEKRAREGWKVEELARFSNTPQGVLSWCDHVDTAFGNDPSYFPLSARSMFASIPCYSEIYRYVKWHNRALQTIDLYGVPSHTLFYEDYETNYDETLQKLLTFLDMDRTHANLPFVVGKRYSTLFEPSHRLAIARLAHQLASPDCWALLKRYFDEFQTTSLSSLQG